MNSIFCEIFYHKSITSIRFLIPSINLSALKNFKILDAGRLDEFFDHTGLSQQWGTVGAVLPQHTNHNA
jgi:hypothetical protein